MCSFRALVVAAVKKRDEWHWLVERPLVYFHSDGRPICSLLEQFTGQLKILRFSDDFSLLVYVKGVSLGATGVNGIFFELCEPDEWSSIMTFRY